MKNAIEESIYNQLFPRQLSKSDRSKLAILEAAVAAYSNFGIEQVRYEEIAQLAGVTRPLVNHHFPKRAVLYKFAVQFVRAQFQDLAIAEIKKNSTYTAQLKGYIAAMILWLKKNPSHVKFWIFFFYQCMGSDELRALHRDLTSVGSARLVALLEAGAKAKEFGLGEYESKAKAIQRLITGSIIELATEYELPDAKVYSRVEYQLYQVCLSIAKS